MYFFNSAKGKLAELTTRPVIVVQITQEHGVKLTIQSHLTTIELKVILINQPNVAYLTHILVVLFFNFENSRTK